MTIEDDYVEEIAIDNEALNEALEIVESIREKAPTQPGLPFEDKNLKALVLVESLRPDKFEEVMAYWKEHKVNVSGLKKRIKAAMKASETQTLGYIKWTGEYPTLLTDTLVVDLIRDLHIYVIAGTKNDLAIYNESTGTYDLVDVVERRILAEAREWVRASGDYECETLGTHNMSKIQKLVAAAAPEIDNKFETNTSLMCVGNGVVDLRTGKLMPWSPDYFMVKRTSIKYNPNEAWDAQAPTWYKVLHDVFDGDENRIEYFQHYMGYCATGETSEDSILVINGIGGAGKSTIIDAIREGFGDYSKVIKEDLQDKKGQGSARDGIARSRYVRMLIVKELDEHNNMSWGTLKELSSTSSTIEARKLYGGTENIKMNAKLVFDTNFMPRSEEPDRSIVRRLKPLPFRHVFTENEKIKHTTEYLANEREGILAWLIDGARKWHESGLGNPAFLKEELAIYEADMDPQLAVAWFEQSGYDVDLKTMILPDNAWVKSEDLYGDYKKFALDGGVDPYYLTPFCKFMTKRGARKDQKMRRGKRDTFWLNLGKKT